MKNFIYLISIYLALCSSLVFAQDGSERLSSELSNSIMSPYCPGRTLAACPSGKARTLRTEILAKAQQGKSEIEIMTWLEDRYGQQIHSAPVGGMNSWLAWTVPIIFVLVGLLCGLVIARRMKKGGPSPATGELSREIEEKLDSLVKDRLS